jgi:carbon-monoxide dehydrogenase small subunit
MIHFTVNEQKVAVEAEDSDRLLDILREKLHLTGTKEGCAIGECGACTVILNGDAVCSCLVLASHLEGASIITIEHLEQDKILSNLQKAFLENGAIQCGFCTPGMLMSAKALLDKNPNPTDEEIKESLEGNLCRCTGYIPIIQSIKAACKQRR